MNRIIGVLIMASIFSIPAVAASFNIDENKDADLNGIQRIIFDIKRPTCAICISTGGQTYSITGGGNEGKVVLSLTGDLKSNNRKALPSLITEKNGNILKISLYKDTGLFVGLIQSGSLHFNAVLPEYFDGDIEIITSSGDSKVMNINSKTISVKSSSGAVEAAELEATNIEIVSSSGRTSAAHISAVNSIKINSSSGDIQLEELLSESAEIKASSGRIEIGRLRTTGKVNIHASSGRINAEYIEGDMVSIDADSGKISIAEMVAGKTDIDSSSGIIEVERFTTGDAEIKSSSGPTKLGIKSLNGDINVKSSSGKVEISIPEGTGFSTDLKASSGSVKSSFRILGEVGNSRNNDVVGDVNGGGYTIRVKSSSGDIIINENK